MSTPDVARLTQVEIRQVWRDEAADFTPWVAANIDRLAEALGIDLELVATEVPTGPFSLDVMATDTGRRCIVVIENQLERTDHDHLGKLLTYASGHDATVAVWISKEMRDEHRQAIDWLNQRTGTDTEFYGVEVRAVSIDGSRPACLFDVVAKPNESRKTVVDSGRAQPSEHREAYRDFWDALLVQLRDSHGVTNRSKASTGAWQGLPADIPWIRYNTWFAASGTAHVHLSLESDVYGVNKRLYDRLEALKSQVEADFGEPLTWERLDQRKYSRIGVSRDADISDSRDKLAETNQWMVERVVRLSERVMPTVIAVIDDLESDTAAR